MADQDRFARALVALSRGLGRVARERARAGDVTPQQAETLQLIAEKPAHGYELIKAIEDRLGGSYAPSPGVVYPTLTLLEEMGYLSVETADTGGRKRYSITASGQ